MERIKHVRGNVLRLAIPLTLQTVEIVNGTATATNTEFIPSSDYPVTVELISEHTKCRFAAEIREGNIAFIEDKGAIPEGTYSLTVCCRDDIGNPMRFKQKCVLQVVDTTAEAGIEEGIEYEVGTWYLDAAVFLAIGGGGSINITVDDELNDSSEHPVQNKVVKAALDGKQESIPDLDDIRRGAAAGATALQGQKRADWEEADPDDPAYILNKPNLFGGSYNDLTDKPTIPDEQEQSDWNESDNTKKAFIKNKPTIPAPQVNADWNASSGAAQILNKPTIPAAQIQSDWNQSDTTALDYIKNKPTIPTIPANADRNCILIYMGIDSETSDLEFSDVERQPLTHSQVIELLQDYENDVRILYNDLIHVCVYNCIDASGGGEVTFTSVIGFDISFFVLYSDEEELTITDEGEAAVITGQTMPDVDKVVFGRLDSGNFYPATRSNNTWIYSRTAVTPEFKKLYFAIGTSIGYCWNGTSYSALTSAVDVVTDSNTGAVTKALDPNKFYKFTGALTSLTLTLNAGTGLCVYAGKFTSDSTTATTLSLPQSVTEASGNPTIATGKTYEFSIADDVLLMVEL